MAKRPSGIFKQFLLLLHKNLLLLWYSKFQLLLQLCVPAIICLLLVPIRLYKKAETQPAKTFKTKYSVGVLDYDKWLYYSRDFVYQSYDHLVYKPYNPCYKSITKHAAGILQISYSTPGNEELYYFKQPLTIVFDESTDCKSKLKYQIRFWSNLLSADYFIPNITFMTNDLFIEYEPMGPRFKNLEDGGMPVGYLREGFLDIQNAISRAFINLTARHFKKQRLPKVVFQQFPYPEYKKDDVVFMLANMVPWIIMLAYMYPMMFLMRQFIMERRKKEVMIMSGLKNCLYWLTWLGRAFVIMGLSTYLVTKVLTDKWGENQYGILNNSSFDAVYFFLFAYIATSITFCIMLATMFSEAMIAVIVMVALWFITFLPFMPYSVLAESFVYLQLLTKLMWSLIPNTALNIGIHVIMGFEIQGVGFHSSNMFDALNSDKRSPSVGQILIAMLVSSCIFILISLYLEQLCYVGKYGGDKKWHFPLKIICCCKKRNKNSESTEREFPESFESEPVGRPIGIQLKNLKKSYGDRQVVKGLSMNMYEGQITVLLGHNGDGKTAIISMMTGMISPTSGTININGYDIKKKLKRARMSLGICPRTDDLYDDLSVKEHLMFYSRLRGYTGKSLKTDVEKYLRKSGLHTQANVASSRLSVGMRRMSRLCTALCGGTKVVLCDQSSSGLDPEDKKMLWDLLRSERKGRTIVLMTNFMDEADMLGDRIAIICNGELKCMGSSLFLKETFGYGFKLTIAKRPRCHKTADITKLLNRYIAGIKPISDIGGKLSYHLPKKFSSQISTLLQEIENQSDTLGVNDYDISMTSLEEVYMKVGTKNSSNFNLPKMRGTDGTESPTSSNMILGNQRRFRGPILIVNQFLAMLWKKLLSTWRNKCLFLIQNLFAICLIASTLKIQLNACYPMLPINITRYRETVTVLETKASPGTIPHAISSNFKAMSEFQSSTHELKDIGKKAFIGYITELGKTQQAKIDTRYIAAATIDNSGITAWFNNKALHSAPLVLNLINNAMAKTYIGPEAVISVTNYPRNHWPETYLYFFKFYPNDASHFVINFGFCMSIVTASYALNVIKERQSRTKLLQFSSGVDVLTYWISHFIWDYATFALTAFLTVATLACFHFTVVRDAKLVSDDLIKFFVLILLFGGAALPFTYTVSQFFTSPAVGMSFLTIINIIYGPFTFIILEYMKKAVRHVIPPENDLKRLIGKVEGICPYYPHFAVIQALKNVYFISECKRFCPEVIYQYGIFCEDFRDVCCPVRPYLGTTSPGITREIIALIIVTCVSSLLLILTEYISLPRLWVLIRGIFTKLPKKKQPCDESVEEEELRVAHISKKKIKRLKQVLVIKKLTKLYGSHVAVNQMSAVIKHYQCFGLLGGNSVGKTTTLKMLADEEGISSGDAFVKGMSVKWRRDATNRKIGYCPQQSYRLFDYLTGREHLFIYALLRGIPYDRISSISVQLATFIGFIRHYYKPVRQYSWKNKRKLSIAMALLGGPLVIYLDEPTTGLDPASQQNVWNTISKVRDAGSTIVLTTRSMAECEVMCTRTALMLNGEFKYIGTTEYIKNRITKGLILDIKLRKNIDITTTHTESDLNKKQKDNEKVEMASRTQKIVRFLQSKFSCAEPKETEIQEESDSEIADIAQKVLAFIRSKFPNAELKERRQEYLKIYIPLEEKWWFKILDMDANKDSLNIEDYSVSKVTFKNVKI